MQRTLKKGDLYFKANEYMKCLPEHMMRNRHPLKNLADCFRLAQQDTLQSVSWILAEFYFNRGLQKLYTGTCIILQKTINRFLCLLGPHIKFGGKIWGKIRPSSPNKRKNLGNSVTARHKSWEKILMLG